LHRDIVVIGGSAGALDPLKQIVSDLPANLPAVVIAVLHLGATSRSALAAILNRAAGLPAVVVDVGKGAENAKWIKLSGEKRAAGRSPSYKFDFGKGEAIDGTQATVRAAVRRIREPGVPDNAHLNMLRHVIERRHPAVGILSIREAIRANQRVRELEAMAVELLTRNEWTEYPLGSRPIFEGAQKTTVITGAN
jgi:CheB methylesterase